MNADQNEKSFVFKWLAIPLLAVLLIVGLPIVLIWVLGAFLLRLLTLLLVWTTLTPRGISMLIVYSNSPYWQTYFETGLLPLVGHRAKILNWSERKSWPFSLKSVVFSLFKGEGHENPMILIFSPFRWPKKLRFYRPFHDARHGKYRPLCNLENELADWLAQPVELTHYHPRKSV